VDAVAAGDAAGALRALEECAQQGRDAGSFASDLEVRARELLVVQTLGELPEELSLTPEADAALLAQAERVEHATVVRLLELLGEAMEGVRAGADARTRLELALVKAARPAVDASVRALLARIERLEASAGPTPPGVPAPIPPPAPQPAPPGGREPSPPGRVPDPVPPTPAPEPPTIEVRDLSSVCAIWPAVVELVRGENARLGAAIEASLPVGVEGDELTLAFSSSFLKKQAEKPDDRAIVGKALQAIAGGRWRLSYELRDELAAADTGEPQQRSEEEWVARFMREFDAEELTEDGEPVDAQDARADERGAQPVISNEKGA
jgi:DNA polymerase-3 subunit gamma/tau